MIDLITYVGEKREHVCHVSPFSIFVGGNEVLGKIAKDIAYSIKDMLKVLKIDAKLYQPLNTHAVKSINVRNSLNSVTYKFRNSGNPLSYELYNTSSPPKLYILHQALAYDSLDACLGVLNEYKKLTEKGHQVLVFTCRQDIPQAMGVGVYDLDTHEHKHGSDYLNTSLVGETNIPACRNCELYKHDSNFCTHFLGARPKDHYCTDFRPDED